jgi:MFS transporter, DHA1 family, inner membrane transport protein
MRLRFALIALAAAYFFIGATSLSIIGLVPEMSADLGVTPASIASLVTIFALVYAVAAPGLQAALGGFSRAKLVSAGLVLVALSCFGSAMAGDYATVAASRATMALGAALAGPTASAAAASMVPPERRAQALATVFAGLTLSTVFGVPLASFLGQTFGWRSAWVAIGLAALLVAPLVLLAMDRTNRGTKASVAALIAVMRDRALALTIATTALQICAQFITYALLTIWLLDHLGTPASLVPVALLVFGIGGVVGNALATPIERRLGPETTVRLCLIVLALALLGLWFSTPWPALILVLAFLWSASGLMIMAPLQSRLVRLAPEAVNLSMAMNASAIYVGMSAGAALSGVFFTQFGLANLPLISVIAAVLALLVFQASLVR